MGRKKGEGTWDKKEINGIEYNRYRKTYNGVRKEFYGRTPSEVKKKIKDYENNFNSLTQKQVNNYSFGKLIQMWLTDVRINEVEASTYSRNLQTVAYGLKAYNIYNLPLANITKDVLQEHINELAKKYSKSTISKVYFILNIFFRYAEDKGMVAINPMNKVKNVKESNVAVKKRDIAYLPQEDVEKLISVANEKNINSGTRIYKDNAWVIIFIIMTGLRVGEMLALTWEDVDFDKKTIKINKNLTTGAKSDGKVFEYIKSTKTENGKRTLPLNEIAIHALKQMNTYNEDISQRSGVVAPNATQPSLRHTLDSMMKRAKCQTPHCSLHGLRHTYGALLLRKHIDIKTISKLLGHGSIDVTCNIYLPLLKELELETVSILNDTFKLPIAD